MGTAQISETLASFAGIGATSVEIILWPGTIRAAESVAPVVEALDRGDDA